MNTICICGAGTMGSGIAQVVAQAGYHTILYEPNSAVLANAETNIDKGLSLLVQKGRIKDIDKAVIKSHLRFTNHISECKAAIFIEAIVEKADSKISLFNQLAEINDKKSIFASNTSSLPVSKIAAAVKNPERVIGMHFFNPAPVMKLVEVVITDLTNEYTQNTILDLASRLGKTPVICKDSPGFIVNRVARPYYIESLRLVEEGVSEFNVIDKLLEATGFKMGPFKLMDLIGNDINYAVSCSVYEQAGKPERLRPSPVQEQKVEAGHLGKKTGKGYYDY
jgi:3-hydroxybutyryl-CoA dehydrogenase